MHTRRVFHVAVLTLLLLLSSALAGTASAGHRSHKTRVKITMPTSSRTTYTNDYRSARSHGAHRATDLMGKKLYKIYAARAGRVCYITGVKEPVPSYGYMVTICGRGGREFSYVHLNNDRKGTDDGRGGYRRAYTKGVRMGRKVQEGQHIGWMGDSGNAEHTTPHLHFAIHDPRVRDPWGGHSINPYWSLRRAERKGRYPG